MRLYWCVNCGYYGDFGVYRHTKQECQICEYNDLLELDFEQYSDWVQSGGRETQESDELYIKYREKVRK